MTTDATGTSVVANYVKPTDPGLFTTTENTNAKIAEAKAQWETDTRNFMDTRLLKSILKMQLVTAFEDKYINDLRNSHSRSVTKSIPEIIQHLFSEYGDLTPEELDKIEISVNSFLYDPAIMPITTVFTTVEDYKDVLQLSGEAIDGDRQIKLGYNMLHRTGVYKDGLIEWNDMQPKTWDTFKSHFRKKHKQLKKINALSIQDSSLTKAKLMKELRMEQATMMQQMALDTKPTGT
mmetsp:Transcript_307/g.491  ORF Transcript_307/g.491 Transcript_307/m.491 type:complete len:235 (+) Transcript_307:716-1420(+)